MDAPGNGIKNKTNRKMTGNDLPGIGRDAALYDELLRVGCPDRTEGDRLRNDPDHGQPEGFHVRARC